MSDAKSLPPFLPLVPPARYRQNFLRQVVCELRFPTLFELNTNTPPGSLARALRQPYPHHSLQVADMALNGGAIERTHTHIWKSKKHDWSVTLRPSALTVETSKYISFKELSETVAFLLKITADVIDSDFFTRIGLRYINTIPMNLVNGKTETFKGWVRDSLVAPIIDDDDLGLLIEYWSRVGGKSDFGNFLLQHGIGMGPETNKPEYVLDFDFSRDDVELADALSTIDELHRNQFTMFLWSLGDLAKEYLGPSIYKDG